MNGVADKIIAHYQRHAAAWDADRRGAGWSDKRWHDRFIGLLPSPAAVLDLGCGGGSPVAVHLVAHCMRVTGIYRSPALIELCRERLPDQNWLICEMRKLNLSRTFDGIFGLGQLLSSLSRSLRARGGVSLHKFTLDSPQRRYSTRAVPSRWPLCLPKKCVCLPSRSRKGYQWLKAVLDQCCQMS